MLKNNRAVSLSTLLLALMLRKGCLIDYIDTYIHTYINDIVTCVRKLLKLSDVYQQCH